MLTKDLIRISSAIAVIVTGIVVLVMWLVSANDRGKKDDDKYECRGCNYVFHEALIDEKAGFSTDLNEWMKNHNDPYPVLVAFGVIVGVFWMITGAIGFLTSSKFRAWVYLLTGVITYAFFVIVFAIIRERIIVTMEECSQLWGTICKTGDWKKKHSRDSYDEFWASALVGFLLGAYQIAAAIYLVNQSERPSYSSPQALTTIQTGRS